MPAYLVKIQFSVISTVRGGREFIDQYFNTISRLMCDNEFEVVIVDDNSSEDPEITKLVSRLRLRGLICNHYFTYGKGRAAALNLGLDKALGRYCFIADFDDIMFKTRLLKFKQDLSIGYVGAITLYGGLYCYSSQHKNMLVRDEVTNDINKAIYRGMPKPHTFMVIDKVLCMRMKYRDIIAGIDYRFIVDAYILGLDIRVINRRVGIHFKYPTSSFAKRSRFKSQFEFLKTQMLLIFYLPTLHGFYFFFLRLIRLPLIIALDQLIRSGFLVKVKNLNK